MSHSSWIHRQPTLLPGRPVPPRLLYRWRAAAFGFFMWMSFALYALYVVRDAGLTPFELLIVGTVLEFSVVAFEIPTGVLADSVSRRLSIIFGLAVAGAGWVVMGLFPSFEGIAGGQLLWGFGYTFISGASEAWLADEMGEDEAAAVYPAAAQWRQAARVAGVLAGAGLGLVNASLPFVVGGAGSICFAVFCLFTMTEAGWHPTAVEGGAARFASMRRIAADGLSAARRRPMVRAAIAVAVLWGASSEAFDRLWGFHLLEDIGVGDVNEVVLFGAIAIASQVGGFGLVALGRRLTRDRTRATAARVLSGLYAAAVIVPLAFALAPNAGVAVALVAMVQWISAAENPFFMMWVNRGLDPRTRATVLSSVEQSNSLGQVVSTLVLAGVAAVGGVGVALAIGALLVAPAVLFVRTVPIEEREEAEGVPVPGD